MYCYYHPDKKAEAQCSGCGKNLCEQCSTTQRDGSTLCSRCLAMEAAEEAARGIDNRIIEKDRQAELKAARTYRRGKIILVARYCLIIIGLVIIFFQAPKIFKAFEEEKPLKYGDYETDDLTDQCLRNLWKVSRLLQEGRLPGDDILCPASKKPFEIIRTDFDVIVRSPDPGLYGFREISVSRLKPVPELVK